MVYRRFLPALLWVALFSGITSSLSYAQSAVLDLPRASQRAQVSQRIGITDITIHYHRPQVKGRKVWGGLEAYGKVWRAGANENTTIQFSDPVTIEGKPLSKGIYGLHMIPGENEWTVIFSKNSTSWGSFTYDQAEDALRVNVKPKPAEFHETLTYDFDDVKSDSTVVTLLWDKVSVPFKVDIKVPEVVQQSLHNQLRGLSQYSWEGGDEAATYLLDNKGSPEDALKYVNISIQNEERFENLITKSRILEAQGHQAEATGVRDKALAKGSAQQLHFYGRQLQQRGMQQQAFDVFRSNRTKNPDQWITHVGMARVASAEGNFDNAVKEMKLAVAGAPDGQKAGMEGLVKRLEAKEDINR